MSKYNIEGLTVLTEDDVENMMVGAYEGGSSYWAYISDKMIDKIYEATKDVRDEASSIRLLIAVQRGLIVNVRDVEDPSEILGKLTKESWAKAEQLMIKNHRSHFVDIVGQNDDATTADVFFQLAVMGEVVYG